MTRSDKDIETLTRLIRESPKGPQGFSDLIATWNGFFDGSVPETQTKRAGEAAETASVDAIAEYDAVTSRQAPPDLGRLLGSFRFPVLLADADGTVVSANAEALGLPELEVGESITNLDLALERAEPLDRAIKDVLAHPDTSSPVLKQGFAAGGERATTIAILPARSGYGNRALALVFLIDLSWRPEAGQLLGQSTGLTNAEREILDAFVTGRDLSEIAEDRDSSLATVRTQFQSILRKTSSGSQAALLRKSIALSGFLDEIEETADAARHPHRISAELLRPGGRKIDVTLAGDPDGKIVIFLAHATQKTFPPQVETAFAAANLCVVSVCRPGTGRTDLPRDQEDIDVCLAEDISVVQSHLGVEASPLLAHSTSAAFGFRTAQLLGSRITEMVVVSGFPPAPHIAAHGVGSPFASAMVRAAGSSPTMLAFLTRTGITAWKLLGTRRFLSLQLANNPEDIALATRPECLSEFDAAFRASLARGTEAGTYELKVGTLDWSPWVRACPCAVTWLHGTKDAASTIDAVRAFTSVHPDVIQLCEFDGAGWMLFFSHTDDVLSYLI